MTWPKEYMTRDEWIRYGLLKGFLLRIQGVYVIPHERCDGEVAVED